MLGRNSKSFITCVTDFQDCTNRYIYRKLAIQVSNGTDTTTFLLGLFLYFNLTS
ncbi:Uncharacterised protein [Segatella copri]|nr:Uncharacterised protein [Segatella copri]